MFNAKTLGRTESAFMAINQNKSFLLIAFVILLGQIGIVQFGGEQLLEQCLLKFKNLAYYYCGNFTSSYCW